jgi:hypothetical protein
VYYIGSNVRARFCRFPLVFIASGGAGSDQINKLCTSTLVNGIQEVVDE